MTNVKDGVRFWAVVIALTVLHTHRSRAEPAGEHPTLRVRLVHPEQQAAEILRVFEGARAPHPAAALAAWKRATRNQSGPGKAVEALIAAFNPEMTTEWRALDAAELRVDLSALDGRPRWHAVVPRDDGAVAAAITALRLTDGADEAILEVDAQRAAVERLGPPGAIVASRVGNSLILANSRAELVRAFDSLYAARDAPRPANEHPAEPRGITHERAPSPGVLFELDPARLAAAGSSPLTLRRTGELLRGLGCDRVSGQLAIEGDCARLSVTTSLDKIHLFSSSAGKPAAVDPAWLRWVPRARAIAIVSIALEPGAGFWDRAFALADRIDRADPARAKLAPLRTRVNLLSAAAAVRLEADLWPHLKGLTACLLAGKQPGRQPDSLFVLHADAEAAAKRLATEVLPRLAARFAGKSPVGAAALPPLDRNGGAAPATVGTVNFVRVGSLSGRVLSVAYRASDVLVAWGDDVPAAVETAAAADPRYSAGTVCCGWQLDGKRAPERLGAFWPIRSWALSSASLSAAARQALEGDPPVLWWGWSDREFAADLIRWPDLKNRAHRFLDELPLDPSPIRSQP